ncbi:MAG: helix-turn-helix transcriptional regulator [Myxococcota bacterium]
MSTVGPVGAVLRQWRRHRRMSQLDLAEHAEISTRHLSCVETGKAKASPEMLLVLASALEMPLKDRNRLLVAAGYAPPYPDSGPSDELARALHVILGGLEPNPAIVIDPAWDLVQANQAAGAMFTYFAPAMIQRIARGERANLMLALVDDEGLRSSITNWEDVAAAVIDRLHREAAAHPGPDGPERTLRALLDRPGLPSRFVRPELDSDPRAFIEVRLQHAGIPTPLRFFTTIQTMGTAIDVAASRLMIETYFPVDDATRKWLERVGNGL